MLVLARRVGQRIRITTPDGTQIWLMITSIDDHGKKVRIGITAPLDYAIFREEVIALTEAHAAARKISGLVDVLKQVDSDRTEEPKQDPTS